VLPSKIHACLESGKKIIFVGSKKSDVHLLASKAVPEEYYQIDVGNVDALIQALKSIEHALKNAPGAALSNVAR
jgi:hypothetical protein